MSKVRTVALVGAIGCAVIAGLMVRNVLNRKVEVKQEIVNTVQTTDILIASKDILMGDRLGDGAVVWKAWPNDNLLPSMISRKANPEALTEFAQARARVPFFKDEPIMDKKVVLPGAGGFMSAILPKGMRALSVRISPASSAGGFILPNDRVDVVLTKKSVDQKTGENRVRSETVISNVRVLAINNVYRQAAEGDQASVERGETATVEITQRQAEVVAMVETSGELSLSLRSLGENEGMKAEDIQPQLADKYSEKIRRGGDQMIIRYGVQTVVGN